MYYLKDIKTGKIAKRKLNGEPFLYSTERLARLGAKWLGRKRKTSFRALENTMYYPQ